MPASKRTKVASLRSKQVTKSTKAPATKAKSTKQTAPVRRSVRNSAGNAKSSSEEEVFGPQSAAGHDPLLMMTGALLDSAPAPSSPEMIQEVPQSPASPQQIVGAASRRTSVQRPTSMIRSFGTPGMGSTMFSFKKRKRQGSIISQVQRALGVDNSNIGNTELDLELDLDDSRFDLDDFNPDDESTPLQGTIMESVMGSSGLKRRRYDDTPSHGFRAVVPRSSSPMSDDGEKEDDDDVVPVTNNNTQAEPQDDITMAVDSVEDMIPATTDNTQAESNKDIPEIQTHRQEDDSELTSTRAPPLSSSMLEPSSPLSSEIDAHGRDHQSIHLSTLELHSLLPRNPYRRNATRGRSLRPAKDVYDLGDTTDLTSDNIDVEPSEPSTPRIMADEEEQDEEDEHDDTFALAPHTKTRASSRITKPTTKAKQTDTRKPLKSKKSGSKAKPTTPQPKSKSTRRSYRRAPAEDKENEEEEETSYAPGEEEVADESTVVELGKEMLLMKQKFADIDDYELAFEIVDHGGESSPWR